MTLTELRYIVAVARERHFGRAAAACFVSQPTLSAGVRKLEQDLGVTLFERSRSEVSLTDAGEQVLDQAQRVLEAADAVKQIAAQSKDQLASPLRLGAIYTIGPYLLPELIPILKEAAPAMPLVIEEGYTAELRGRLKHGELDAILVSLPFEEPGVEIRALYDEPFVALLPASHPWTLRDALAPADLARENVLLLGRGHCFRDQVIEACPECVEPAADRLHLQHALEGSSLETIRHMVAGGIGITVVPCTAAGADRYSQRLLKIRRFCANEPKRRVVLAWRRSFPRPEAIQALRKAVLDCPLSCVHFLPADDL